MFSCCYSSSVAPDVVPLRKEKDLSFYKRTCYIRSEICKKLIQQIVRCEIVGVDESIRARNSFNFYNNTNVFRSELTSKVADFLEAELTLVERIYNAVKSGTISENLKKEVLVFKNPSQFDQLIQEGIENSQLLDAALEKGPAEHIKEDFRYRKTSFEDRKVRVNEKLKSAKNLALAALVYVKIAGIFQKCILSKKEDQSIFLDRRGSLIFRLQSKIEEFQKTGSFTDLDNYLQDDSVNSKTTASVAEMVFAVAQDFFDNANDLRKAAIKKLEEIDPEYFTGIEMEV